METSDKSLRLFHLEGQWGEAEREYSGAAELQSSVVLMPQYPARCGNQIPVLPMQTLLSPGDAAALTPQTIAFDDDGLASTIGKGFEGFESIAFRGDDVFVTMESHNPNGMLGYLVRGKFTASDSGAGEIRLDATTKVELQPRAKLGNLSDESIVILPDGKLLTFYEANGANVVPHPTAYLFDVSGAGITKLRDIPVIPIEYRVTDCTPADAEGKFWCVNYMFPGDQKKLNPAEDKFAERWGVNPSQAAAWAAGMRTVERLIQLQFDGAQVRATDQPPIYIPLRRDLLPSNWEGIVQVADSGFFLVTDKFPETLFGFLRRPPS